jgi:hypothetical protein
MESLLPMLLRDVLDRRTCRTRQKLHYAIVVRIGHTYTCRHRQRLGEAHTRRARANHRIPSHADRSVIRHTDC